MRNVVEHTKQQQIRSTCVTYRGSDLPPKSASGSKNLTFTRNTYLPSMTGWYWLWNSLMPWSGWQSIPHDATGTVGQ